MVFGNFVQNLALTDLLSFTVNNQVCLPALQQAKC